MKKHFQGLGHIAIYAKDLDESIAFYQKLGATLARRSPIQPPAQKKELALMAFDGFTLELIGSDAPQARGPIPHFAVYVDDVEQTAADLRAAGIDTFQTPQKQVMPDTFGGLENWFFTGPSGELIELLHML